MKLLKKIVAAVVSVAVAATLVLSVRPYDVSADDTQMVIDESAVTGWFYLEGLNVRINCANTDLDLSTVYGFRVTFGDVDLSNGAGGGAALCVPSKAWWSDQVDYSNEKGLKALDLVQVEGTNNYTLTRLGTSPAFPDADIDAKQGGFAVAQWWGVPLKAIKVEILGQGGTVLLTSPEEVKEPEAPKAKTVAVGETVNLATSDKVTLEGLADAVQDKNMMLDGVQVSDKVIGLKPAGDGSSKVSFTVEAEKAGTYEIEVVYNAKGSNRPMAIKVNDEKAKDVALPSTSDSNYTDCGVKKISVHLNKGQNVITFSQASNYDNNNVKTPNLVTVKTTLTKADAPETPSTGVAAVAIPVAVAMLASGAVALKASKKDEQ